jgi:propanol-preferring alcohol dehydrogenase
MRAMILEKPKTALKLTDVPIPEPSAGQVLIKISACAVCRTDLHIVDGELPPKKSPVIPGHEIVGIVVAAGSEKERNLVGKRVGVPWLGWTCGRCRFCLTGRENLCDSARFTGYHIDGGYAEYTVADTRFIFEIPKKFSSIEAAPLLCAGLIGYRSFSKTGPAQKIGIYGFGAAAHIITQIATHKGRKIYAFTRPGDVKSQNFARQMGAIWAGGSDEMPPEPLDAAIIFAPVGSLLVNALRAVDKGGIVVCGGIYMSDIPSFPYKFLWEERTIVSVANLTRTDGEEFMKAAAEVPLRTSVRTYPLEKANEALADLRSGNLDGAAVLVINKD